MRIGPMIIALLLLLIVARWATGSYGPFAFELQGPCYQDDFDRCRHPESRLQSVSKDSCEGDGRRVCLVPLGSVSFDLMQHLVEHYRVQYGLEVAILRPIGIPDYLVHRNRTQPSPLPVPLPGLLREAARKLPFVPAVLWEPDHDQIGGVALTGFMRIVYEKELDDSNVVLIGVTPLDLYYEEEDWRFAFGVRGSYESPQAVISTFRMDARSYGDDPDPDKLRERLRKMTTKYIGLLHYGLPESSDPDSPLYNRIYSLRALDRLDEPLFDPPLSQPRDGTRPQDAR